MRWGAHPVHGVGARGRRSERTQGLSPSLSMIPPRGSSEPERLVGASPQTRWGQGMERVIGIDVEQDSPSCPSSAPSTAARSPAWSGWRRSPGTAAPGTAAARSAVAAAGPRAASTWPRSSAQPQQSHPAPPSTSRLRRQRQAAQARPRRPDAQDAGYPQRHAAHLNALAPPRRRRTRRLLSGTRRDRRAPRRQPRRDPRGLRAHAALRPRPTSPTGIAAQRRPSAAPNRLRQRQRSFRTPSALAAASDLARRATRASPNALWRPDPGERGGMRGLRAARTSATEGAPGRAPLTAHCGCDVGLDDHSVAQPFLGRSSDREHNGGGHVTREGAA